MTKYIRYALAIVCFVASVGCLALWWCSYSHYFELLSPTDARQTRVISVSARCGVCFLEVCPILEGFPPPSPNAFQFKLSEVTSTQLESSERLLETWGSFSVSLRTVYFPLWYPALIFALAAIGALRLGRRFTLRSAIIATAVVAGLLGMAVIL